MPLDSWLSFQPIFFLWKQPYLRLNDSYYAPRKDLIFICLEIAVKPETRRITGQYVCGPGLLLYFHGGLESRKQAGETQEYKQRSFFSSKYMRSFNPATSDLFYIQKHRWQDSAQRVWAILRSLQHCETFCYRPSLDLKSFLGDIRRRNKQEEANTRTSCDPLRPLPNTKTLWFALVLFVWDSPDQRRQEQTEGRFMEKGGQWKKWGSPRSVFVNKVSPPAVVVPGLDFSTVEKKVQ